MKFIDQVRTGLRRGAVRSITRAVRLGINEPDHEHVHYSPTDRAPPKVLMKAPKAKAPIESEPDDRTAKEKIFGKAKP